jgi:hypothetical protein
MACQPVRAPGSLAVVGVQRNGDFGEFRLRRGIGWGGHIDGQFEEHEFACDVGRERKFFVAPCLAREVGGGGFHCDLRVRSHGFGVVGNEIFGHPGSAAALHPEFQQAGFRLLDESLGFGHRWRAAGRGKHG